MKTPFTYSVEYQPEKKQEKKERPAREKIKFDYTVDFSSVKPEEKKAEPAKVEYEFPDIELSAEDGYFEVIDTIAPKNENGLKMLLKMARAHEVKSMKIKGEKYFNAWAQSMRDLLKDNGITETEFLNQLKTAS